MQNLSKLIDDLETTLDPCAYIESLHTSIIGSLYWWQRLVLKSTSTYILINGARRAGKSAIIAAIPTHTAKVKHGSITLIVAPTQSQAQEDMRYVKQLASADPYYPKMIRMSDSQMELSNGSRIIVLPATEAAARGYPDPDLIITDEAAFIPEIIHRDCLSPMLNANSSCRWIQISTTHGKNLDPGKFFYESSLNRRWERYEIRAPVDVDPDNSMNLIPALPEEEYKKEKAEHGIIAGYSPRHMDWVEQMRELEDQGPAKYQRNQLALFVDSEEQVFSYEDIRRMMDGSEAKGLLPHIEESEAIGLFV